MHVQSLKKDFLFSRLDACMFCFVFLKNLALFLSPFLRKHVHNDVSKDSAVSSKYIYIYIIKCLESSLLSEKVEGFDNKYTSTKITLHASLSAHPVSNFVVCGTFTSSCEFLLF